MPTAQPVITEQQPPQGLLDRLIFFALHPGLIVLVLGAWYYNREGADIYLLTLIGVQVVLGVLEYWRPARPDWRQNWAERSRNIAIWLVGFVVAAVVISAYETYLTEPLMQMRTALNLDIWPHHWPVLVQLLMVFFMGEFIWYWLHRAEHQWSLMWRITGHGAHHSFKRLGAINAGANHPFEMLFLVAPAGIVELFFGVGAPAAGAALLTVVQPGIAHTNLRLNSSVIGWLFTTADYHIRHHSVVIEESNTNFGCAGIIWDRLFGTFADSYVYEAGTGPTEPSTWAKFIMPFKEPEDTQTSPGAIPEKARAS